MPVCSIPHSKITFFSYRWSGFDLGLGGEELGSG